MMGWARIALLAALAAADSEGSHRIGFTVAVVEETPGGRRVLAETIVEGPPGTDFDVDFRAQRFSLQGRFVVDLVGPDELEVGASLEVRRLHGTSERGLPLHEIDEQKHALRVGFDQAIAILPFGPGTRDGTVAIEIAPGRLEGRGDRVDVRISRPAPTGLLHVAARKIPHRFVCEAKIVERGREIATSASPCRLDRPSSIEVADLVIDLTVDGYRRDRPTDLFAVSFDVRRRGGEPIARRWAGAGALGSELSYDLGGGRELRLSARNVP